MRISKVPVCIFLIVLAFSVVRAQSGWIRQNSTTDQVLYSVDFMDDSTGTVCGDDVTILRTADSGQNWFSQTATPFAGFRAISFAGPDYGLAIGSSGAIVATTDGGNLWNTIQQGMQFTYYYGAFQLDSSWACAVGSDRFLRAMFTVTTDGWQTLDTYIFNITYHGQQLGDLRDVHFLDPSTGCAVGGVTSGEGVVIRTVDGGLTWATTYFGGNYLYALDFPTPLIGYAVGFNGTAVKTTDAGQSWIPQSTNVNVELLDVSFATADIGTAVGGLGFVVRTVDGGQNWYTQNLESLANLRGVSFPSANIGYAVGDSGIILHTTTGGEPPAGCDYAPGDVNNNGIANGLDVIYLVAFLKGGSEPPLTCPCNPHGYLYVAGDVNGGCDINGLDVTYLVSYFKGGPGIIPCPDCPPTP